MKLVFSACKAITLVPNGCLRIALVCEGCGRSLTARYPASQTDALPAVFIAQFRGLAARSADLTKRLGSS